MGPPEKLAPEILIERAVWERAAGARCGLRERNRIPKALKWNRQLFVQFLLKKVKAWLNYAKKALLSFQNDAIIQKSDVVFYVKFSYNFL